MNIVEETKRYIEYRCPACQNLQREDITTDWRVSWVVRCQSCRKYYLLLTGSAAKLETHSEHVELALVELKPGAVVDSQ